MEKQYSTHYLPEKCKQYGPESKTCVRGRCLSAIFLLNKIMVQIFQIIHIQNQTLNLYLNESLEQRRKVQTRLQGLFTF